MNIEPIIKKYTILPYFHFINVINPLTEDAKATFNQQWNNYWHFECGWLCWYIKSY